MNRLLRHLDPLFGLALAAALLMVLITAWPGTARAADRVAGPGDTVSEPRPVPAFDAVLSEGLRVLVRQGPATAVSVTAPRHLLPLLETVVEDGLFGPRTLVLRWKRGAKVKTPIEPVVTVVAPRIQALAVRGGGDVVADPLQVDKLQAKVSGSGDIRLDGLRADELSLEVKGAGDIVASGRVTRLVVGIAGSGDVKTDALQADEVRVNVAGSGDVSVQAVRSLTVSIAGSGDVVYSGNPSVSQSIAGSGSVTRR